MTVDRGGLQYGIEVENRFSDHLERFKAQSREAQRAWRRLKNELQGRGRLKGAASDLERLNRAQEKSSRESRKAAQAKTVEQLAEEKLARILKKRLVDETAAGLAKKRGIKLSKDKFAADLAEAAAEERLARIVERRAIAERVKQLAEKRGISLSEKKAQVKTVEQLAEERLARILKKRLVDETAADLAKKRGIDLSQNKSTVTLTEAAAEERLARIVERRAITERVKQLAEERGIDIGQKKVAVLTTEAIIQDRVRRAEERLALAQASRSNSQLIRLEAERIALERINREQIRLRVNQILSAQGFARLGFSATTAETALNRISFTFRRLFGILAAFTLARFALEGFFGLVIGSVRAQSELQQVRIGLEALVLTSDRIEDAQGRILDGQERINAGVAIGERIFRKVRVAALKTNATVKQLSEAVQTAFLPALNAGFNEDQIIEFAKRVSLAASALGLSQEALAEEIRSLITGRINIRQTRLGLLFPDAAEANRRIKEARQQGRLADFLLDKLAQFERAGEQALNTLPGAFTNLADAFFALGEQTGFLDNLISIINSLRDSLVSFEGDNLIFNETALRIANEFSDAMKQAALEVRNLFSAASLLSFSDLKIVVAAILGFVRGLVRGASLLSAIVSSIVGDLSNDAVQGLSNTAALLGEILVVSIGISVTWSLTTNVFGKLLALVRAVYAGLRAVLAVTVASSAATVSWAGVWVTLTGSISKALGFLRAMVPLSSTLAFSSAVMAGHWLFIVGLIIAAGIALVEFFQQYRLFAEQLASETQSTRVDFDFVLDNALRELKTTGRELLAEVEHLARQIGLVFTTVLTAGLSTVGAIIADAVRSGINSAVTSLVEQLEGTVLEEISSLLTGLLSPDAPGSFDELVAKSSERLNQLEERLKGVLDIEEARYLTQLDQIAALDIENDKANRNANDARIALDDLKKASDGVSSGLSEFFNEGLSGIIKNSAKLFESEFSSAIGKVFEDAQTEANAFAKGLETKSGEDLEKFNVGTELVVAGLFDAADQFDAIEERIQKFDLKNAQETLGLYVATFKEGTITAEEFAEALSRIEKISFPKEDLEKFDVAIKLVEAGLFKAAERFERVQKTIEKFDNKNAQETLDLYVETFKEGTITAEEFAQALVAIESIAVPFSSSGDVGPEGSSTGGAEAEGRRLREALSKGFLEGAEVANPLVEFLLFDEEDEDLVVNSYRKFLRNIEKAISSISLKDTFSEANVIRFLLAGFFGAQGASGTGGGPSNLFVGLAKGGVVPRRATPSPAHFLHPQGMALGGRPRGLDPRDTIPVWARPNEFFVRPEAHSYYGTRVLQAINNRLVDGPSLSALVGSSPASRVSSSPASSPGKALGGPVASSPSSPQQTVTRAVVVADEASLETMLAGGRAGLLRFLQDNSADVKQALGV